MKCHLMVLRIRTTLKAEKSQLRLPARQHCTSDGINPVMHYRGLRALSPDAAD